MPFAQRGRSADRLATEDADPDRTCVWTLTPAGVVEHCTSRRPVSVGGHRRQAGPRPWRDYWPEEGRASVDRAVAIAASGHVARFRLLGSVEGGDRAYWETVLAPVRSTNGAIVSLLATSSDVTADVERESLLNTVVQLLPSPLAVKDVESGGYILWNLAAEAAFGLPADKVLGSETLDALGGEFAAAFTEAEISAVRTGERQNRFGLSGSREATTKVYDLQTLATFDDFGARHLISLCNDVSGLHEVSAALKSAVEAAEQASEAKSRFLANMSHELRTPMNGIVVGADMLSGFDLPQRAQELVALIQGSGIALGRLLSGILDIAAIEAGAVTLTLAPFHLGELVRRVAGLARLLADEKSVALKVELDADSDIVVHGDEGRIGQALTNLLNNAVKFTERGEVRLSVLREADATRFEVFDTGIGFDEDAGARIFDRFQQGDPSITRRFGGSGLGLAITRELVALMEGRLGCESTPGVGSTFWFEAALPAAPLEAARPPGQQTIAAGHLRVLVADDHPTNRRVVELLLGDVAEVVSVADGREAVEAFRTASFDLILMDIQMPVLDGFSAVREIRALEAASRRAPTPIMMLSANVAAADVVASREAGANYHSGKPLDAAKLFAAIGEILA
jgi:signal transduction histidine kinase/ActR/RegA family two-component response regulator